MKRYKSQYRDIKFAIAISLGATAIFVAGLTIILAAYGA